MRHKVYTSKHHYFFNFARSTVKHEHFHVWNRVSDNFLKIYKTFLFKRKHLILTNRFSALKY